MPQVNKDQTYQIRNVMRSVLSTPWLIQPEKMDEIMEFLEARQSGNIPSEDELLAAFGPRELAEEDDGPRIMDGGIQVIDIMGTMAPRMNLMSRMSGGTSTMKLAQDLQAAKANPKVNTVILRVDSPGGAASFTPEAVAAVRDLATEKRVITSATNMMASAAYWVGSGATEVYASPSTQVGSIGVYSILQNVKEAYEKEGVKFTVLRAGSLKAAGNPYEELTAERQAALQKRVTDIYEQFLSGVAENRNVSMATVESSFGQGNVFLAAEAAERKMIDGVMTFDQVLAREQQRALGSSQATTSITEETKGMNPKLKAALFARGLVASLETDDATCTAVLNGYRAAANLSSDLTEEQLTEAILKGTAKAEDTSADETDAMSAATAVLAERERCNDLRARGEILGISAEDVQTAIDNGTPVASAVLKWTDNLASNHRSLDIEPGLAELDKISIGASAVIEQRYGVALGENVSADDETRQNAARYGASFANKRLIDIARAQMGAHGQRPTGDDLADASAYLQQPNGAIMAAGSSNSRGAHPDMLSSITRKALTQGAIIANVSYNEWCERIEDLPDFKPKSFIDAGIFNKLDAIEERDAFKDMEFQSGLNNWIQAHRFGNKVPLTVEMIVDDDLGGFLRQLRSLGLAAQMTLQSTILDLWNSNPTMLDGETFFSAAHGNIVGSGSGGTPVAAQMKLHRKAHRLNTSYGSTFPMGVTMTKVLVPAEQEEVALQTLSTMYENKVPATDATVNTFRGQVTPIVDSYLDAYSTAFWYTFIPKEQAAACVYAFQRGFGPSGRREDWYDNNTKNRYVSLETRFGVALSNWRAVVRNYGS